MLLLVFYKTKFIIRERNSLPPYTWTRIQSCWRQKKELSQPLFMYHLSQTSSSPNVTEDGRYSWNMHTLNPFILSLWYWRLWSFPHQRRKRYHWNLWQQESMGAHFQLPLLSHRPFKDTRFHGYSIIQTNVWLPPNMSRRFPLTWKQPRLKRYRSPKLGGWHLRRCHQRSPVHLATTRQTMGH